MQKKILIASYDIEIRDLIKKCLDGYGFEFIEAASGISLTYKSVELKPDLIIMSFSPANLAAYHRMKSAAYEKSSLPIILLMPPVLALTAGEEIKISEMVKQNLIVKLEDPAYKKDLLASVKTLFGETGQPPKKALKKSSAVNGVIEPLPAQATLSIINEPVINKPAQEETVKAIKGQGILEELEKSTIDVKPPEIKKAESQKPVEPVREKEQPPVPPKEPRQLKKEPLSDKAVSEEIVPQEEKKPRTVTVPELKKPSIEELLESNAPPEQPPAEPVNLEKTETPAQEEVKPAQALTGTEKEEISSPVLTPAETRTLKADEKNAVSKAKMLIEDLLEGKPKNEKEYHITRSKEIIDNLLEEVKKPVELVKYEGISAENPDIPLDKDAPARKTKIVLPAQIQDDFEMSELKTDKPVSMGKILLADDETDIRDGLKETLESEGYTVTTVKNGNELIEVTRTVDPDLIIADVIMPGLSGYRAVGKLKAEQKYIKVPVIFMTARVKDEEMYESLKPKGPSYFIPKTIEMDDFLKKLKEILGKK